MLVGILDPQFGARYRTAHGSQELKAAAGRGQVVLVGQGRHRARLGLAEDLAPATWWKITAPVNRSPRPRSTVVQ
jgi:hypothetical protein